jgi:7-keto-8-aminopelargonate synthetase-like enzyme
VHDKADRIRRGFLALGFNTGPSVTPTIPITIGDTIRTMGMWKVLFDAGVFVNSVLTPAAPKGVDLLRTSHIAWPHQCAPGYRVLSAFEVVGRNPQA